MVTDKSYSTLSDAAYDSDEDNIQVKVKVNSKTEEWNIIDNIHTETGLDAAVFKKKNSDEIVIAFRGTEASTLGTKDFLRGLADLSTDADYVVGSISVERSILPNQFKQADDFAKKIKKDYPNANVSTTGHSLGGALASYVSAMNEMPGVTYNSPSVVKLLPEDLRKRAENGGFDSLVVNYIHPKDSISAGAFSPYERHIGSSYYIGSNYDLANHDYVGDPFRHFWDSIKAGGYHYQNHFTFDQFGNINNPIMTDVLTRREIWKSPRFMSGPSIDIQPQDLLFYADSIPGRINELAQSHSRTRDAIFCYTHIPECTHIEDTIDEVLGDFFMWLCLASEDMRSGLTFAANKMKEADQLI